ncbi:hypothetical protein [Stutzerimonas chloritidismutans]|uniref:hypothetical protein n=1 Tax=Stutzerimonas chloritidismutans TaxID=203192 RepID=UPI003F184D09
MNTAISTQRIPTGCAIGIALLISGTTVASSRADLANRDDHPNAYEVSTRSRSACTAPSEGRTSLQGKREAQTCKPSAQPSAPIHIAQPLSENYNLRSSKTIRYIF